MTDLNAYRQRKAAARAYHPSVRPIWTPADSVSTAQAFAAELDRAEHGTAPVEAASQPARRRPRWSRHPFGHSRFRRAKIMDAIAVALLMAFMAALGVIVFASTAKADDSYDAEAYAYAAHYGSAVCAVLDDYTSVSGVLGVMDGITQDGLTPYQAGQVVGISVTELCPQHGWLLDLFIDRYGSSSAA